MNKTLKLTFTAMLTALNVVANIFTIPIGHNNAISFTFVLCFVAGIYLGIIPAMAVGFIGDLLAHFIHPFGAYNYFIGLSSLLMGLIVAVVFKMRGNKLLKTIIATIACFCLCTCGLNTFGLWLQYIVGVAPSPIGLVQFFTMDKTGIQKSFWVYMMTRAPYQLINIAVNAILVATLQQTRVLDKLILKLPTDNSNRNIENSNNGKTQQTKVSAK